MSSAVAFVIETTEIVAVEMIEVLVSKVEFVEVVAAMMVAV